MLNVKHMAAQEAADTLEAASEPRRMRIAGMLVTTARVGGREVVVVQAGGDFLLIEDADASERPRGGRYSLSTSTKR